MKSCLLKNKINELGLSQIAFSKVSQISPSQLSNILNNWIAPSDRMRFRLRSALTKLNCTQDEINHLIPTNEIKNTLFTYTTEKEN